ncbi:MAG: hypothetical protein INQ03_02640 [Candidatus Heimdallarchaeota archaeon]|nr:hypothetical protein [Candidatus Heimdallarchaeota archaeon]
MEPGEFIFNFFELGQDPFDIDLLLLLIKYPYSPEDERWDELYLDFLFMTFKIQEKSILSNPSEKIDLYYSNNLDTDQIVDELVETEEYAEYLEYKAEIYEDLDEKSKLVLYLFYGDHNFEIDDDVEIYGHYELFPTFDVNYEELDEENVFEIEGDSSWEVQFSKVFELLSGHNDFRRHLKILLEKGLLLFLDNKLYRIPELEFDFTDIEPLFSKNVGINDIHTLVTQWYQNREKRDLLMLLKDSVWNNYILIDESFTKRYDDMPDIFWFIKPYSDGEVIYMIINPFLSLILNKTITELMYTDIEFYRDIFENYIFSELGDFKVCDLENSDEILAYEVNGHIVSIAMMYSAFDLEYIISSYPDYHHIIFSINQDIYELKKLSACSFQTLNGSLALIKLKRSESRYVPIILLANDNKPDTLLYELAQNIIEYRVIKSITIDGRVPKRKNSIHRLHVVCRDLWDDFSFRELKIIIGKEYVEEYQIFFKNYDYKVTIIGVDNIETTLRNSIGRVISNRLRDDKRFITYGIKEGNAIFFGLY